MNIEEVEIETAPFIIRKTPGERFADLESQVDQLKEEIQQLKESKPKTCTTIETSERHTKESDVITVLITIPRNH